MPTNQRNPRVQGLQHRDRVQHQLQAVFDGANDKSIEPIFIVYKQTSIIPVISGFIEVNLKFYIMAIHPTFTYKMIGNSIRIGVILFRNFCFSHTDTG